MLHTFADGEDVRIVCLHFVVDQKAVIVAQAGALG